MYAEGETKRSAAMRGVFVGGRWQGRDKDGSRWYRDDTVKNQIRTKDELNKN